MVGKFIPKYFSLVLLDSLESKPLSCCITCTAQFLFAASVVTVVQVKT